MQGGVAARMRKMGGMNAAVEVGKHKLDVALGSAGELFLRSQSAASNY
jgi:hypothetical protein